MELDLLDTFLAGLGELKSASFDSIVSVVDIVTEESSSTVVLGSDTDSPN